jgi:hypothetical protein
MAKYGFCSQCGGSVWLNEQGGCPNGHGPESISGVVDQSVGQQPPPVAAPARKKSKTLVIVLVVVALMMVCGCALLAAVAIPAFNASSDSAQQTECFSNQRTLEGAYQQWLAKSDANKAEDISDYSVLEGALMGSSLISGPIACPSKAGYTFDSGVVTCSKHGHY